MFGFEMMWPMFLSTYGKDMKQEDITKLQNNQLFVMYFNQLANFALSMFEWEGLPEELEDETRWIEMNLMFLGKGVMFKDPTLEKYLFLQVLGTGSYNMYGNQEVYQARGYNGFNVDLVGKERLGLDNSVICWTNYTRTNSIPLIIFNFAQRMADVQRTLDVRCAHLKTPVFYKGNNKIVLTLKNLWKKVSDNEPFVVLDDKLSPDNFMVIPNDINAESMEFLYKYKKDLWNEAMLMMGVDNSRTEDKKERLITAEVESNDEQIELSRQIMLNARLDFCNGINKMYGLNMTCKFRTFNQRELQLPEDYDIMEEEGVDVK